MMPALGRSEAGRFLGLIVELGELEADEGPAFKPKQNKTKYNRSSGWYLRLSMGLVFFRVLLL